MRDQGLPAGIQQAAEKAGLGRLVRSHQRIANTVAGATAGLFVFVDIVVGIGVFRDEGSVDIFGALFLAVFLIIPAIIWYFASLRWSKVIYLFKNGVVLAGGPLHKMRIVAWSEVVKIRTRTTRYEINGSHAGTFRGCRLELVDGSHLTVGGPYANSEWLTEAVEKRINAGLLPRRLESLRAGNRVDFRAVAVDQYGVHHKGRTVAWHRIANFSTHEGRFFLWEVGRTKSAIATRTNSINEFPAFYSLLTEMTAHREAKTADAGDASRVHR